MKKHIKLISFLVAFGFLSTLITGCGNSKTANNELNGLDQIKTKNLKEVTLTFYLPGEEKPDVQRVLREIEKKTKDTLNIKLDIRWIPNHDYFSDMKEKFAQGDKFDGFYYQNDNVVDSYLFSEEVNSGKIMDLSKLLPKYAPNLFKSYTKKEIKVSEVDGELLAIPRHFHIPKLEYVVVREDLMKKYKLPEIKTFDDYAKYLEKIKKNEKGMMPGSLSLIDSFDIYTRANDYFVLDKYAWLVYKKNDADMKIKAWEATSEFKKLLDYYSDWTRKGYISKLEVGNNSQVIGYEYNEMLDGMMHGKLGSFIGKAEDAEYLNTSLKTINPYWKFKAYLLYPDKKAQLNSPIDGAIAFNAKSPNVDRALEFIEWVNSSQENYDLFMYGINGDHYTLEGDKIILSSENNPYNGWDGEDAFQNINYERYPANLSDNYVKTNKKIISDNSEYPTHSGFLLNYTDLLMEKGMRCEDINDFICVPLADNNGQLVKKDLDLALQNLKDIGSDKLIVELQKQLDNWRKKYKK